MDDKLLNGFRELFWAQLRDYAQRKDLVDSVTPSGGDEIEQAVNDRDNLLSLKLQGREEFYIKKVREALRRIQEKSFGICHECGGEIELSRLNARPVATLCISCKEEQERSEEHILYQKRSHTLGRGFSNVVEFPKNQMLA